MTILYSQILSETGQPKNEHFAILKVCYAWPLFVAVGCVEVGLLRILAVTSLLHHFNPVDTMSNSSTSFD